MSAKDGDTQGAHDYEKHGRNAVAATFPVAASAPSAARRALSDLHDLMGSDHFAALRLVVSELVTNAFLHGPVGLVHLHAAVNGTGVELRVTSPAGPHAVALLTDDDHGGPGLRLVDQLADDWGTEQTDAALTVWAVLPL